jgi:ubiquinone biosynthesis protein UbiJ
VFQSIHIDWQYYLSLLTGDIIAKQSSGFIKNKIEKLKILSKELRVNIGEYLQEEIRVTPHYNALELFYEDIDKLRTETDLLEAQILQIKREIK